MATISSIHARQILDSRGNPTIEVDVELDDGSLGRASIPSGSSTGSHESLELRDGNPKYFQGKSVIHAEENINNHIAGFLNGRDPFDQIEIDSEMVVQDGTKNLSIFGANAILGVSLAVSKAAANSLKVPYYQYIHQLFNKIKRGGQGEDSVDDVKLHLPTPMFNVLNGGTHTDWESTDVQEFMIVPLLPATFAEHLRWCTEIYHRLGEVLKENGHNTTAGDEGGFAPHVRSDQEAIEFILTAIERAGYKAGTQIGIAIDAAASQFWKDDHYELRVQKKKLTGAQMISMWESWLNQFPIIALEDGLAEDDWENWQHLTAQIGQKTQVVGDDLLVTNLERIAIAIEKNACNSLLMKVNQIGTLTESLQAVAAAKNAGWKVVVSHRSGETEDTSIADIVVGTNAGQIKAGAPAHSERLAKYNQLLRIEEELTNA